MKKSQTRVLVSVTDKSGIVDFAHGLEQLGYEIISTGGTAKALRQGEIKVREDADLRNLSAAALTSRGFSVGTL